jgi:flagellin-specific chaperone FliS
VEGKVVELKRVNLNYLVRKYVNMLYKDNKKKLKNKKKILKRINLEEFAEFIKQHPKLFDGLYKAFNLDIWGVDQSGALKMKNL